MCAYICIYINKEIDVLKGGKLTSKYPFSAPYYSLENFAVVGGAVAIPGG